MTRLCLDTSAYSHFKRGDIECVSAITNARTLFLPTVVLGELRVGFRLGSRYTENEKELQAFLAHPLVQVLDVDDQAASIYAELVVALRHAGTPVPTNDIWVAALAVREGATVITYDIHFSLIGRVGSTVLRRSPG